MSGRRTVRPRRLALAGSSRFTIGASSSRSHDRGTSSRRWQPSGPTTRGSDTGSRSRSSSPRPWPGSASSRTPMRARSGAPFDAERVAEVERVTRHDVARSCRSSPSLVGTAGRWVHFGADLLGRPGHRSRAAAARRERPPARAARTAARRRQADGAREPGRGDGRPDARRRRGADQLRSQGGALGVRARPRPRPVTARARP